MEILNLPPVKIGQVILALDFDNFLYGLMKRFGMGSMGIERRLQAVMDWTKGMGELLGGQAWVFAPDHFSDPYRKIFDKLNFQMVLCPKKYIPEGQINLKTNKTETLVDTVDDHIMGFVRMMVGHPNFETLCLVSADKDYVGLFKELGEKGIKRSLVVPSMKSLAKNKKLYHLVDEHPITGKKMFLRLDKV